MIKYLYLCLCLYLYLLIVTIIIIIIIIILEIVWAGHLIEVDAVSLTEVQCLSSLPFNLSFIVQIVIVIISFTIYTLVLVIIIIAHGWSEIKHCKNCKAKLVKVDLWGLWVQIQESFRAKQFYRVIFFTGKSSKYKKVNLGKVRCI